MTELSNELTTAVKGLRKLITREVTKKVVSLLGTEEHEEAPKSAKSAKAAVTKTEAAPGAKRASKAAKKTIGGAVRYDLTNEAVLELITNAGDRGTSAEELRNTLGGSPAALSRRIGQLCEEGKVRKTGRLRGTRYFAVNEDDAPEVSGEAETEMEPAESLVSAPVSDVDPDKFDPRFIGFDESNA